MMKLLVLAVLCGMALAGHHGHGGYGGGIGGGVGGIGGGGIGGGGGGYGGGHGGWGWKRPYYGWANVNAWQTPHAYQYGLQEHGKGYQKYIWQGADFHKGWGHGGGYAG